MKPKLFYLIGIFGAIYFQFVYSQNSSNLNLSGNTQSSQDFPTLRYDYSIIGKNDSYEKRSEYQTGEQTKGNYYIQLPEGESKSEVQYIADDWGFHPIVRMSTKNNLSEVTSHFRVGNNTLNKLDYSGEDTSSEKHEIFELSDDDIKDNKKKNPYFLNRIFTNDFTQPFADFLSSQSGMEVPKFVNTEKLKTLNSLYQKKNETSLSSFTYGVVANSSAKNQDLGEENSVSTPIIVESNKNEYVAQVNKNTTVSIPQHNYYVFEENNEGINKESYKAPKLAGDDDQELLSNPREFVSNDEILQINDAPEYYEHGPNQLFLSTITTQNNSSDNNSPSNNIIKDNIQTETPYKSILVNDEIVEDNLIADSQRSQAFLPLNTVNIRPIKDQFINIPRLGSDRQINVQIINDKPKSRIKQQPIFLHTPELDDLHEKVEKDFSLEQKPTPAEAASRKFLKQFEFSSIYPNLISSFNTGPTTTKEQLAATPSIANNLLPPSKINFNNVKSSDINVNDKTFVEVQKSVNIHNVLIKEEGGKIFEHHEEYMKPVQKNKFVRVETHDFLPLSTTSSYSFSQPIYYPTATPTSSFTVNGQTGNIRSELNKKWEHSPFSTESIITDISPSHKYLPPFTTENKQQFPYPTYTENNVKSLTPNPQDHDTINKTSNSVLFYERNIPLLVHNEKKTPYPVHVNKYIDKPIYVKEFVDRPVEKIIEKSVPVPVPYPVPYPVEKVVKQEPQIIKEYVDRPVERIVEKTIPIEVPYPVKTIVEKEPKIIKEIIETPVDRIVEKEIPIPYPVNVESIVEKKVPYPVHVDRPYPVEVEKFVDRPYAVPYPVEIEKIIQTEVGVPYPVNQIVEKEVKVPYPVHIDRIVEKEVKVPYRVEVEKIVEKEVKVPYPVVVKKNQPVEKYIDRIVPIPYYVPIQVEKVIEKFIDRPVEKIVEKIIEKPTETVVEKVVNRAIHIPVPYPVNLQEPQYFSDAQYLNLFSRAPDLRNNFSFKYPSFPSLKNQNDLKLLPTTAILPFSSTNSSPTLKQQINSKLLPNFPPRISNFPKISQLPSATGPKSFSPISSAASFKMHSLASSPFKYAKDFNYEPKFRLPKFFNYKPNVIFPGKLRFDDYYGPIPPIREYSILRTTSNLHKRSPDSGKNLKFEYGFKPPFQPSVEIDDKGVPIEKTE